MCIRDSYPVVTRYDLDGWLSADRYTSSPTKLPLRPEANENKTNENLQTNKAAFATKQLKQKQTFLTVTLVRVYNQLPRSPQLLILSGVSKSTAGLSYLLEPGLHLSGVSHWGTQRLPWVTARGPWGSGWSGSSGIEIDERHSGRLSNPSQLYQGPHLP